ncbi:hypothetical protein BUALT_Bualt15G0082900 [Buddleja alternifolia]|uniref:Uncharacterized protein n=1 Tax=Buddleja alternifolia TaxID=168488 RepID=A0AAV6WP66_9LAMI|nr:hypothetical protein BUALT_Bualt15G0082900 [Buddleja alternifolia]
MNFVYMLPGWEGCAADGRVLRDVILQMDVSGSFTTSCRGRKPVVCRRMWTRPEENALVQELKEILTSGWKTDNGFHVGYLNVLQDKIMKVFPTTDLRAQPHISSKMHA